MHPDTAAGADLREELGTLLGAEGVEEHPSGPLVAHPSTPGEAAAVLRAAAERGWRVRPVGAGVGLDLLPGGGGRLGPSAAPDLLLGTGRMAGVLDYEPADLTLRAGAGTTLAELDAVLRPEAQWLPLDPPGGDAVTLGGVMANGVAGPLAPGFGRPRDLVLGLGILDGRGRSLPLGGRVVKNVAGFDLVRLVTGSRGALGFVHEVSLRLFPRPQVDRTLEWRVADRTSGIEAGRRLARLPLPFTTLEFLDGPGGEDGDPGGGPRILLRILDAPGAADRLEAEARRVAGNPSSRLEGEDSAEAALARSRAEGTGTPFLRLQGLPDSVGEVVRALDEALPEAADGMRVAVHLAGGTVRAWGGRERRDLLPRCEGLARRLATVGAMVRVLRLAPEELRRAEGQRLGPPPAPRVARLHGELRRAFDPEGILPGSWREGWE